jgi:hypothetical protein
MDTHGLLFLGPKKVVLHIRYRIQLVFLRSHSPKGNELMDERARHATLNGAVFDRPFPPVDFQGLARSVLLREWQGKWDAEDNVRFAHFLLPKVYLRPWIEGKREDR